MFRGSSKSIAAGIGAVVLMGTLAACASGGGSDEPTATKTVTTTASPAPAPSSASPSASSSGSASGTGGAGGSGGTDASGTASGDPAHNSCVAGSLSGSIVAGGGGAAGSVEVNIALKNTSTVTCSLQGWPGVSFVGDGNGTQIGAAATLDRSAPHAAVSLLPGGTVTAPLKIVQAGNYSAADCSPRAVDGFRVYPPGSKQSVFIADTDYQACESMDVGLLDVKAFVQG
jgi:hypothetical protein